MGAGTLRKRNPQPWLALALCAAFVGCQSGPNPAPLSDIPRELTKATLPDYVIEPPDILTINALRVVPRPPYRIEPLDVLAINVTGTFPEQPIAGLFTVEPDGIVSLGFAYGSVSVADMTIPEARKAIEGQLKDVLKAKPQVTVSLAQSRAMQQIRGDHLVRQDGTVGLGTYGSVRVVGLTLEQAKLALEAHLSRYLVRPELALEVGGFNSKVYYVITDYGGSGEQVIRVPITGNETVLDAVSQVNGLSPVSSKKHIWVSRPAPADATCNQVLPVDWEAITQAGSTATNYQIFPGDRVFIKAQPLVTLDTRLARFFSPIERILGVTLLGSGTIHSIAIPLGSTGNGGGGGGGGF